MARVSALQRMRRAARRTQASLRIHGSRAIKQIKMMPPTANVCAQRITARRITVRNPKMPRSSVTIRRLYGEWNLSTRDVAVGREHLPADGVGAGFEGFRGGGERVG